MASSVDGSRDDSRSGRQYIGINASHTISKCMVSGNFCCEVAILCMYDLI